MGYAAYPVTKDTIDMLYTAIAADSSLPDSGPTLAQHNTVLGAAVDPSAAFAGRMTAAFPAAAFVLGLLIGLISVWGRRLEIASALHTGVRKLDQITTLLFEALAWSIAGAATAIPVIALLSRNLAAINHLTVVLTACLIPVLTVSGAILGTLIAGATIREQRLFSYFKGR